MRRRWAPDEVTAARHYGRALAVGKDEAFTAAEWATMTAWFGGKCLACGATPVTVDHVVPLSRGGGNGIANVQTLCGRCNSSKGDTTRDYREPMALVQLLELLQEV